MLHSEKQILEAVNKKNKALYKLVYDAYYATLCRYAKNILHNKVSEEDVVQDVLVRFWEADLCFDSGKALATYLYRAVYHASLNIQRDRKEITRISLHPALIEGFESGKNEDILIEEEYFRQIHLAIESLSSQRRTVIFKTLEGKNNEEIAQEMNVSLNTVKTLKKKAYNDLREKLPAPLFVIFIGWCGG